VTDIERWAGRAIGRSQSVAYADLLWTVANARDTAADFAAQVLETFAVLEQNLEATGSSRRHLLSVQVLLSDIGDRDAFDRLWCAWIGDDPQAWPQRACYGAALAPGLRVELIVTAARTGQR
jgi:enamine deaminase RidA (YjgF/YER057c/UK114 family)